MAQVLPWISLILICLGFAAAWGAMKERVETIRKEISDLKESLGKLEARDTASLVIDTRTEEQLKRLESISKSIDMYETQIGKIAIDLGRVMDRLDRIEKKFPSSDTNRFGIPREDKTR